MLRRRRLWMLLEKRNSIFFNYFFLDNFPTQIVAITAKIVTSIA